MNFINQAMDAAKDMAENALEAVQDLSQAGMMKAFQPVLKGAVENVLGTIGPEAGQLCADQVKAKYETLAKFGDVDEKAKEAATTAVNGQKDLILDFCEDAVDDLEETFPKIGSVMLKAVRGACTDAVQALLDMIPKCCGMCHFKMPNADEIREQCITQMTDKVKKTLKDLLQKPAGIPVPEMVVAKINEKMDPLFEKFDASADVGESKKKRKAEAPAPETMGKPAEGAAAGDDKL